MAGKGFCLQLSRVDYNEGLELQAKLAQMRRDDMIPDTLIILEHTPCYTVGRSGGFDHILAGKSVLESRGIRVYETDRGGDVTYHGPGQIVCYPIFNLKNHESDVHLFARNLEEVLIRVLREYGVQGARNPGFPGVWTGESKIAFMGLAIQHWITSHGVSLNVNPDLGNFSFIVPCGLTGCRITSMEEVLGAPVNIALVKDSLRWQFSQIFNLDFEDMLLKDIKVAV